MADETAERARRIIAQHLGIEIDRITDAARLADLGADSLDNVEIAMALEDDLGEQIDDGKVADWRTVGDVIATVKGLA